MSYADKRMFYLFHPNLYAFNFFLWASGDSDSKESACDAGDLGSIARSGRSPGEGNGYLLQCSSLENSMERGGLLIFFFFLCF